MDSRSETRRAFVEALAAPEAGFTTRFEMRQRVDPGADLRSDLAYFLSDDDRTPLAILAAAGLVWLEADGQLWELGAHEEPDGSLEATALSADENLRWQLFPVRFEPSPTLDSAPGERQSARRPRRR